MKCRFCDHPLTIKVADLNSSPPSNDFLTVQQLGEGEMYYPLVTYVCEQCYLVQLDEFKKATDIF
jgi:hypothetical protein